MHDASKAPCGACAFWIGSESGIDPSCCNASFAIGVVLGMCHSLIYHGDADGLQTYLKSFCARHRALMLGPMFEISDAAAKAMDAGALTTPGGGGESFRRMMTPLLVILADGAREDVLARGMPSPAPPVPPAPKTAN